MAQVLTKTHVACTNADPIAARSRRSTTLDEARQGPARKARPPLPFRAVNVAGNPGYDPGLQRHHLLPRQLRSQRCFGALFEDIAQEWPGFDDFRSNGLLLPASDSAALRMGLPLHRGPHRNYNALVIERVGQVEAHWSRARRRAPQSARSDAIAGMQLLQRALRRRLLDAGRKPLALSRFDPLGALGNVTQIDALAEVLWPACDPWADERFIRFDQAPAFALAFMPAMPQRAASLAFA